MDGDASMIGLGTPPDIGLGTPKGVAVVPAAPPTADDPFAESAVKSISLEELAAKGFATRDEENWCCSIIMLISMCVLSIGGSYLQQPICPPPRPPACRIIAPLIHASLS